MYGVGAASAPGDLMCILAGGLHKSPLTGCCSCRAAVYGAEVRRSVDPDDGTAEPAHRHPDF